MYRDNEGNGTLERSKKILMIGIRKLLLLNGEELD